MITSGLLLTLHNDAELARTAVTVLQARPELTLGEGIKCWLPVVAEVPDVSAGRNLHDWLLAQPGVAFVDVVQVNFDDAEAPSLPSQELIP